MEKKYVFYFDQGEGLNGTIFADVRGNKLSRIRGEGGGVGPEFLPGKLPNILPEDNHEI